MVDEDQYRRTYRQHIAVSCPYEKAILSRICACEKAAKSNIAEREAIGCSSSVAQQLCVELVNHTRKRANFALGVAHTSGALPHAKAIKVQCGGLLGLQRVLDGSEDSVHVHNVHGLIRRALKRFKNLDALPFEQIIRSVARYEHRRRRSPVRG